MVIYKYKLRPKTLLEEQVVEVKMPINSQILKIGVQDGDAMMWAAHPEGTTTLETRKFLPIWTGENFNLENLDYVDTVQIGPLVTHWFEVSPQ